MDSRSAAAAVERVECGSTLTRAGGELTRALPHEAARCSPDGRMAEPTQPRPATETCEGDSRMNSTKHPIALRPAYRTKSTFPKLTGESDTDRKVKIRLLK